MPVVDESIVIHPTTMSVEDALAVLARRHVANGYRMLTARLRRHGYLVNRKKVQRLLRVWGVTVPARRPHPKAQGRPFEIDRSNALWQTDLPVGRRFRLPSPDDRLQVLFWHDRGNPLGSVPVNASPIMLASSRC